MDCPFLITRKFHHLSVPDNHMGVKIEKRVFAASNVRSIAICIFTERKTVI